MIQVRGLQFTRFKGGPGDPGSGHHGHAGRPGSVGGSVPGGSGSPNYTDLTTGVRAGNLKRSDDSDSYDKGIYESYRIDIEGDGRAIVKPEEFDDGASHREVASYQLSEALELGIVPPTISTTAEDGRFASCQAWQEGMVLGDEAVRNPNMQIDLATARGVLILDAVTGHTDRHGGNWLIDPKSGKVMAIDNGQAFYYENRVAKSSLAYVYTKRGGKDYIKLTNREKTKLSFVEKDNQFWDGLNLDRNDMRAVRKQIRLVVNAGGFRFGSLLGEEL